MITLESIIKKLGYNPLRYNYLDLDAYEDDRPTHRFDELSVEELDFIYHAALNDPECWTSVDEIRNKEAKEPNKCSEMRKKLCRKMIFDENDRYCSICGAPTTYWKDVVKK